MITLNAADTLVATAGSDTTVTVTVFGDEVTVATGAQSYKVLYQGQPAAAGTTAITVGAGLQHLISDIHVTNTTGSPATIKLAVNGSGAAYVVLATTTLGAGYSYIYSSSGWTMHDAEGAIVGTSLAAVSDGDKGDITITAGVWEIDAGVVTLAKMANLAQDQFIGRTTASTGVPETATVTAAARTVLDDATTSDMRTTLGLAIGTNVQAYDADLTTWAGITPGANVGTALAVDVGTDGAFVVKGGALGTPSSGVATNLTGTAAGLTAGNVTTNANLTGPVTSVGNATTIADAELAALAGLTSAADKLPYFTGAGTASVTDFTAAARTVLDDTTVSAMVDTLGGASAEGTGGIVRATSPTITTPTIAKLANLTSNGYIKTSGGDGTLGVDTALNLDDLDDVTAPTPISGDSLVWSGSAWIASAASSVVGSANHFYPDATASLADNYTLSVSPSAYAETANAQAVTSTTAPVFFERFVSGALGRDSIPAGTWTFRTYGATSSNTGTNEILFRINKRVIQSGMTATWTGAGATRTFTVTGGTPFVPGDANASALLASLVETPTQTGWISGYTSSSEVTVTLTDPAFVNVSGEAFSAIYYLLFSDTTGDMTGTSPALYTTSSVQAEFSGLNLTDRIVLAYFANNSEVASHTLTLYYGGVTNFSSFVSPLTTLHNDLAGLNAGDYKHATAAEYTGTGTGVFVRKTNAALETPNIGAATGTSLSVTGQLTSTVAIGTPPLAVTSTTQVANLYAARAALADTVTTNANLTGPVTSVGNATTIADAELAALAGLTSAADKLPYFTGSGTAALADFTAAGRALVDDASASDQRTTLGLAIGTDVQAYDADLTTWAGITPAANVGTFLATPSSANLIAAVTDETGTGALVFASTPTLVTPEIGAATGTSLALTTALTLEETGAGTEKITVQASADIDAAWSLTLPNNPGTNNYVLKTDGSGVTSWVAPGAGTGDVVGPASATDEAIARFDSTTGKLIQNSSWTITDAGAGTGTSLTLSSLTAGRVPYVSTAGLLADKATITTDTTNTLILTAGSDASLIVERNENAPSIYSMGIQNRSSGTPPIGANVYFKFDDSDAALRSTAYAGGLLTTRTSGTVTGAYVIAVNEGTAATCIEHFRVTPAGITLPTSNTITVGSAVLTLPSTTSTLARVTGESFVTPDIGAATGTSLALTGTLELGHATDTTLARSGAGDVTIEGNAIYRAGGTDVNVADGGTGRSTGTTAYALVATGTTATGAQQTLANGATTEILVGGGASALPVWTTATGTGAPVREGSPTFTGTAHFAAADLTGDLVPVTAGGSGLGAAGNGFSGIYFDESGAGTQTVRLVAPTVAANVTVTLPSATSTLARVTGETFVTPEIGVATGTSLQVTGSIKLKETGGGADVITVTAPASSAAWTMTLPDSAGTNAYVLQTNGSGTTSWVAQTGGSSTIVPPQGRLTLTTGTPVLSGVGVTDTQTIYYTPYVGGYCPIYSGSAWSMVAFSEITYALHATPHVIDTNYDMFIINDAGTLRLATGPAWSSATARADAITMQDGLWVNNANITLVGTANATSSPYGTVTAKTATYVGTFRTTGTAARTTMIFNPTAAAGGTNNQLFVYNEYNQVPTTATNRNANTEHSYTAKTWKRLDDNDSSKISYVTGQPNQINAEFVITSYNVTGGCRRWATLGYDSSTVKASGATVGFAGYDADALHCHAATLSVRSTEGYHYVMPLVASNVVGTSIFILDDNDPDFVQAGTRLTLMM